MNPDEKYRLVFSFKYSSADDTIRSKGSCACLTNAMSSFAGRIARFACAWKHVEISVPVEVMRRTNYAEKLNSWPDTDFKEKNYFTLAVAAFDVSRGTGGVSFVPRGFTSHGYIHLAVPRTRAQVEKFIQFAIFVSQFDTNYAQNLTDVYLWPGWDERDGWYCVSLTTAAGQAADMFEGFPHTEMSTGVMMRLCKDWYQASGELSNTQDRNLTLPVPRKHVYTVQPDPEFY